MLLFYSAVPINFIPRRESSWKNCRLSRNTGFAVCCVKITKEKKKKKKIKEIRRVHNKQYITVDFDVYEPNQVQASTSIRGQRSRTQSVLI